MSEIYKTESLQDKRDIFLSQLSVIMNEMHFHPHSEMFNPEIDEKYDISQYEYVMGVKKASSSPLIENEPLTMEEKDKLKKKLAAEANSLFGIEFGELDNGELLIFVKPVIN